MTKKNKTVSFDRVDQQQVFEFFQQKIQQQFATMADDTPLSSQTFNKTTLKVAEYFEDFYQLVVEAVSSYEMETGVLLSTTRSNHNTLLYEIFEKAVYGIIFLFQNEDVCSGYYFVRVDEKNAQRAAMVLLQADEITPEPQRRFKRVAQQMQQNEKFWVQYKEYFTVAEKSPKAAKMENEAIKRIVDYAAKLASHPIETNR